MKILIKEQQLEDLVYRFALDKLNGLEFRKHKNKDFDFFVKGTHDADNGIEADWVPREGYHILIGNSLFRSIRDMFGLSDEQTKDAFIKAFFEKGIKKIAEIESLDFSEYNFDNINDDNNELYEHIIKEQFNAENVYPKSEVLRLLKGAPKELRDMIKTLPSIPCENDKGVKTICTRISENIWVYLTGRY
jgi:hypothetical protein